MGIGLRCRVGEAPERRGQGRVDLSFQDNLQAE